MDVISQTLKWRCREHSTQTFAYICLDGDAKDRVMCRWCVLKYQIPLSYLLPMSFVLEATEQDILGAYPPLKDQEIINRLMNASLKYSLEEIEAYFKQLRDNVEREIESAKQRAKQDLQKQVTEYHELLEGYKRIAEVKKLQELIVSEKESAEKDLDDFIKEKWSKAEENKKIIQDLISQNEAEYQFSFDEPNKIALEIIESLKNISFFQPLNQTPQINLIKSTLNTSQQMEISKINNSIYQIKKQGPDLGWDQVFLDPIIDPLKKYILQIELEQQQGHFYCFQFGLVKDEGKDNTYAFYQDMCFFDYSNSYGITKQIKGLPMLSGSKQTGKYSFEVRIDLNQKFLRVATLPNYSSISEIDPNRIDPKVPYRFFLALGYEGDMMRITNIRTVSKFDEKM